MLGLEDDLVSDRGLVREEVAHLPPHQQRDDLVRGQVPLLQPADVLAVAKDDDPGADLGDLVQAVAHVEHRDVLGLQGADDLEELFDLVGIQRGGRLVEDDHRAGLGGGPDDLDTLLLGDGEIVHEGGQRQIDAEPCGDLPGALQDRPLPDPEREPGQARLASEHQVLGDGQVVGQRAVLVDCRDACGDRVTRLGEVDFGAPNLDRAVFGDVDAGQHLDQGGLSSPVLAEEADDLPRMQRDLHVVEGGDIGEDLGHPACFDAGEVIGRGHVITSLRGSQQRFPW